MKTRFKTLNIIFMIILLLACMFPFMASGECEGVFADIKAYVIANSQPDGDGDYIVRQLDSNDQNVGYVLGYTNGVGGVIPHKIVGVAVSTRSGVTAIVAYDEVDNTYYRLLFIGGQLQAKMSMTKDEAEKLAREVFKKFPAKNPC